MTESEYTQRLKALTPGDEQAKRELMAEYALSNNPYKVGDIIKDARGRLRIERIEVAQYDGDRLPYCEYYGLEVRKDGKAFKNQSGRCVCQKYIMR